MNNWENFKKKEPEAKPEGREINGMYRCQFCQAFVFNATYFPVDKILKYKCADGHVSFIEDFKVSF